VIGGLLVASIYTLIVVPVMYATIRTSEPMEEIILPEATPIEEQFAAPGREPGRTPSAHPAPAPHPSHG